MRGAGRSAIRTTAVAAVVLGLMAGLLPADAGAAKETRYEGKSSQRRNVDLITGARGAVLRGAFTYQARCSNGYRKLLNRIRFDRPNRSRRAGFRRSDSYKVKGEEGRFSARYRYEIDGRRVNGRRIEGKIAVKVRFYDDGERYTTCKTGELKYRVRSGRR